VQHKLRELQLWPGFALGNSLKITVSICNGAAQYVTYSLPPSLADMWNAHSAPKAIDGSLPPSELISDAIQRVVVARSHV